MAATWRDLTRPVHPGMPVFQDGDHRDVDVEITGWSTLAGVGFATQRLVLGTQTGTHIDAPAHFVDGGATLDALPAPAGIGPYRQLRLADLPATWPGGVIPVLDARDDPTWPAGTAQGLAAIAAAGTRVVVLLGQAPPAPDDPWRLNRLAARAGLYLVEDLADGELPAGPRSGRVVVAWPHLIGVTGAPCRVLLSEDHDHCGVI